MSLSPAHRVTTAVDEFAKVARSELENFSKHAGGAVSIEQFASFYNTVMIELSKRMHAEQEKIQVEYDELFKKKKAELDAQISKFETDFAQRVGEQLNSAQLPWTAFAVREHPDFKRIESKVLHSTDKKSLDSIIASRNHIQQQHEKNRLVLLSNVASMQRHAVRLYHFDRVIAKRKKRTERDFELEEELARERESMRAAQERIDKIRAKMIEEKVDRVKPEVDADGGPDPESEDGDYEDEDDVEDKKEPKLIVLEEDDDNMDISVAGK